jgi:hypothetical protein
MSRRRYALILAFGALALWGSCAQATESQPSNTVGFWKLEVGRDYTQISFPLLPADKSVDNVLGDQLTGGNNPEDSDQILRWDPAAGQFQMCWFNEGTGAWEGDFDSLSESSSYWIYVQQDHPVTQTLITHGNVIETPFYIMGAMAPGYNAVGSIWAIPAPISTSGLTGFQGGLYLFQSDLIMNYDAATGSYSYAWKDGNGNWLGGLTQLEPLRGYWIYVAPGHPGFVWNNYPQPIQQGDGSVGPYVINPLYQRSSILGSSVPLLPAKGMSRKVPPKLGGEK